MAKNFGKKNVARRNPLSQLAIMVFAFSGGYACATLFDFTHLTTWLGQQFFAEQTPIVAKRNPMLASTQLPKPKFEFYTLLAKDGSAVPVPNPTTAKPMHQPMPIEMTVAAPNASAAKIVQTQTASLPTMPLPKNLANTQKLPLHAPLIAEAKQAISVNGSAAITKEAYSIQVASFRNLHEAQKMKATLVMKGFDVNIATAVQNNLNWYRVMIGPFASRQQAQRMQVAFARSQHIIGMIRKTDV